MYDEESYQYQTPPRSPVPVAALTAAITTILLFFGLRLLEDRGVFGRVRGAEVVEVPSVVGYKLDQAREVLRSRDLVLTVAGERDDPRFVPGAVSVQSPQPGATSPRGAAVQVTTARSGGPPQVPNLVGVRGEDAIRQLAAAGLGVGTQKTAASATVPIGAVMQTDPPAGTPATPGAAVSLVISAGPSVAATTIPKVLGQRLAGARKLLEEAGFRVGRVRIGSNDDRMGGVVLKQEPAAGTPAPPGTEVSLIVNED